MAGNLYASVLRFKRWFAALPEVTDFDTGDLQEIEKVLESASRSVDDITGRHFFSKIATKVLDGKGFDYLYIPDLIAATSIKLDEDGDRTFELALAANADYYLKRHGSHEDEDAPPYTRLELDSVNGQRSAFLVHPRLVEIVGRWGYSEDTEDTLEVVPAAGWTNNATTLALTNGSSIANGRFSVGQTLFVGAEQLYIRATTEGASDSLVADRGVNGTTAVAHVLNDAIRRFVYHPSVRDAALIIAGRQWKRRETNFANVFANPVVGSFETFRQSDPDVARLLDPLRRGVGVL